MVKQCPNEIYESPKYAEYSKYFEMFSHPLAIFQKYSIEAVVNGHHSLACVPTGSGKTLCGEFAIRHAHSQGKRSIFLSPLKALSNQKFYDFSLKYPEITFGISTGDIKTGGTADCIIMTNEVFLNLLFGKNEKKGELDFQMDIETELGCVVFDEIHLINDPERGHVLEKIIMLLPNHIQMVMLSGTLDSPLKFAKWVESCGNGSKEVWLSCCSKRIVPLTHYSYIASTESFLKNIKDKSLQQLMRQSTNRLITLQSPAESGANDFHEGGYKEIAKVMEVMEEKDLHLKRKFVVNNVCEFLREKEMLPAIFFVFSRKQVETIANEIQVRVLEDDSKVPYTVARECEQIVRKFPNFREYLELPEYHQLVRLLEAGIGIHHAGMLQVLREIVEFMLSKKYIKVLICTSTFAAGLNFAIRTVVMTNLRIFSGRSEEYLTPQDYAQMGGRAGRLGIDKVGHVVHLNNLFPLPLMGEYKTIMCGKPTKLTSKFTISYSMVLNILGGKFGIPENFSKKSMIFEDLGKQSESQKKKVDLIETKIQEKKKYISETMRTQPNDCISYLELSQKLSQSVNKKRREIEKEIAKLRDSNKYLEEDAKSFAQYLEMEKEWKSEKWELEHIDSYIDEQTAKVESLLAEGGFLEKEGEDYVLTTDGKIAAGINEIHPLIVAKCLKEWNWMEHFSEKQIIGWMSLFVDVRVSEENRKYEITEIKDEFLQYRTRETNIFLNNFQDQELRAKCNTGYDYFSGILFDLVNEMMEWSTLSTEQECKAFLQENIQRQKEISAGDFAKACMKISNITKELSSACSFHPDALNLVNKLSKIDGLVLKYIVTNQSLYV